MMGKENPKKKPGLYASGDLIGNFLCKWRIKAVLPFIKGDLIDIACGDNLLVNQYGRGTGVDVIDYGLENVKILANFEHLPFIEKKFDTAAIIASINYFDEPHKTLAEIRRILKDNGQLIITMPNSMIMGLWHRFRERQAKNSSLTKDQILELLAESGFALKQRKSFMFGLNWIYLAEKI